ncbi:MAG: tetratricopeptide repeat protein [Spirochaetaceae bacterium]|jgi:tetratricopeptide (TPR) repeat protein|nr:tetratricopeptide repeat protein [Spirochaetaceae bacterium]
MRYYWFAIIFISICFSVFPQTDPGGPAQSVLQIYRAGRDLEAVGRMEESERYYAEAVRICMDEISRNAAAMDTYAALTWTLRRQRKFAEVISWGERALQINANDYRIIETMGEAYFYLDDYPRSLSFMQRYVNSLPNGEQTPMAYFFIGEIFRLQRKFRHADIAYTTALQLAPSMSLWWYRLGSVREASGDYIPAMQAYEQALRLNPNYPEASQGLDRVRRPST